ncbi:katanin-interacting protein-like isoform X2 [Haliotis rufescens]|uniref:katanin-interacting protein-like isoform X2 n=1 Tax=Haliotis rufescens TaxID=6454 RepID=UPI00201F4D04|nr:katanin-interacting protein-like isoform X2 [Haliotis rufescens]
METSKSRKKWGKGDPDIQVPIDAPAVREEIFPHHEEYLMLLQEKNRLIKKLREKNSRQIQIERKEQGFALYVNGANAERDLPIAQPTGKSVGKVKLPKTAGEMRRNIYLNAKDLVELGAEERRIQEEKQRARTAPSKTRRKGWNVGSVDITTASGDKRKVRAPNIMTGNYEDDFEMDDSGDYRSSGDERDQRYDSDSDLEIDARGHDGSRPTSSSSRPGSSRKTSYLKRKAAQIRQEEELNDRLTLTLADVRRLRQSLEMNASIRQSLAKEVSSGLPQLSTNPYRAPPRRQELIQLKEEEDMDHASTIDEEDEEIEEDLSPGGSTGPDSPTSPINNIMKPNETIVLEFAALPSKGNLERNLSAARKKNTDTDSSLTARQKSRPLPSPKGTPSSTPRDLQLRSVPPSKKKSLQPLSANRKSDDNHLDSREEASAVLRALQEENSRAARFNKDVSKSPRPELRPSSGDPQRSKSRLSSHGSADKLSPTKTHTTGSADPQALTDERVSEIVTKVMVMPPKQQRRLIKILGKLDEGSSSVHSPTSPSKSAKLSASRSHTSNKQKSSGGHLEVLEVNMEILSNWGHPDRVGLTEIQFFNSDKQLIPVRMSDVSVHGATGCRTSLDVLFNGKPKTTKERYMWSCEYEDGLSVEFVITLHNPSPNKPFCLSAIKLWNFNKSLNDLNIGARHTRIFVGGELVFDGDIDKGCGNQAFDYSKVVDLSNSGTDNSVRKHSSKGDKSVNGHNKPSGTHSSPSPRPPSGRHESRHVRSETRTLHHSSGDLRRPSVGSDRSESSPETEEDGLKMPEKGRVKTPRKPKRLAARLDGHNSETDTSRSVSDSLDPKSPLGPIKKTPNMSAEQPPPARPKSLAPLEDGRGGTSPSPRRATPSKTPLPRDSDDTPMLQKLKDMNISDSSDDPYSSPDEESALINQCVLPPDPRRPKWLHNMLQHADHESQRKKDVPTWLNAEDVQDRFKSPPASRAGQVEGKSPSPQPGKPGKKSRQDASDPIVLEDMGVWPQAGVDHLSTVLDKDGRRSAAASPSAERAEADDLATPMMRIQKNRARWRGSHDNLEEEWGSLSLFNKQQRGRLSVDMGDGAMEEYLSGSRRDGDAGDEAVAQDEADQDENFVIPELPYGQELVMNIKTTWGDQHYVGLTGIDIFSSKGEPVTIKQISAKPKDINELPDYHKDPRVITNIIDGVNRTRDDVHMWLAPFTPAGDHKVFMTFEKPCKIAMIRIWNYNKSRIHSYRGAKDVTMTLDKQVVFKGEIARACGGVEGGTEAFGDTILFTMDEGILEEVSKNDEAYDGDMFSDDEDDVPFERPTTADNDERPFTRAAGGLLKQPQTTPRPTTSMVTYDGDLIVYKTKRLELDFTATWGDMHYLGLSGLEIADKDGEPIPLKMSMVSANPRDLHGLPGHEHDDRTLDKLINGSNITLSDEHMWLIPFTPGNSHTITINFDQQVLVSAIRIWNYNKTPEDTYRGAKVMHVRINGKQVSPDEGYLLRKGPGNCHFDFAQEVSLSTTHRPQNSYPQSSSSVGVDSSISYEVVQMPCGFIYQLQLFTAWGDQYYVGLNGLQVYDSCFNLIQLTDNNISAFPESCNVLDNIHNDVRTPDKLIDGKNDTTDGKHMWLAPVLPSIVNRVYIIFDQPTTISMIKLWNYSKTPNRGVKDFALLVDDLLVYNGRLQAVTTGARGILPHCQGSQQYHTVLFTDNKEILRREKNTVISNQTEDQDIQLLNDKQIVSKYTNPKSAQTGKPVNQALRPKTSVPLKRR